MGDARETEKAPDAFRTISEVAEDLALPQHVLRFWETRFPQIKPVKRAGGRRFYRPEDVDLLRGIRHLLYTDGFTIKGAQRILKDQGVRYVQDLGIEREVAVMRSARPQRGEAGEGVTFGGLLGLLPRRRPKAGHGGRGGEDDVLPDLPDVAELPLPFPDAEADRDLADEPPEPPIVFRQPPRARAPEPMPPESRPPEPRPPERRRGFDAPEAGQRREPTLGEEPPHPSSDEPRGAPRMRERVEPVLAPQRPSRGPAARLPHREGEGAGAAPPHPAAFDDPLLPFLEDIPVAASAVSEPIEARIQRLRAQERRPLRPHEMPEDDGPPEEYIPPRARRAPPRDLPQEQPLRPVAHAPMPPTAPRRAAWEADAYPPEERRQSEGRQDAHLDGAGFEDEPRPDRFPPRTHGAPSEPPPRGPAREPRRNRAVQDEEWRQTDWVEAAWHDSVADEAGPAASDTPPDDEPLYRPVERHATPRHAAMAADPETEMMNEERRRPPLSPPRPERREPSIAAPEFRPQEQRPKEQRPQEQWPQEHHRQEHHAQEHRATGGRPPASAASMSMPPHARPMTGWADEEVRRVWDEGWGEGAPQSLPRATRIGPLIGPIHEDEPQSDVLPEAEQRRIAERMAGRAAPAPEPYVAPQRRSPPPWSRGEAPLDLPNPAFRAEPASYVPEPEPPVPREPLRPGPPEQYLPPHLRSEARMTGQAPMAAPALSRDDVHRMQSALYELGECRRLMEEVLAPRNTDRPGG